MRSKGSTALCCLICFTICLTPMLRAQSVTTSTTTTSSATSTTSSTSTATASTTSSTATTSTAATDTASATDSSWSNAPWPTTRFIVRNSGGVAAINTVCQLLGCNVVEGIGDPDGLVFLVQDVGLLPPPAFLNKLLSAAGVVDAEPDQTVLTLAASVQQIPGYLNDRAPITYYGANVWEGYVLQTPNQIVRSSQAQTDFGVTGSGVTVAVIDTGVDPNNAILQSVLLPGYDFTRNNNGGSEMGDISQSTAGVIDGNIAQLSQSTAGVIDQSTAGVIDTHQYAAF